MKQIEKLAIILIVAGLLHGLGQWFLIHRLPFLVQSGDKEVALMKEIWGIAAIVMGSIISIGCAAWLYWESSRHAYNKWIWCLLGLSFSLPAVAIFYGVAILDTLKKNANANPPPEGTH